MVDEMVLIFTLYVLIIYFLHLHVPVLAFGCALKCNSWLSYNVVKLLDNGKINRRLVLIRKSMKRAWRWHIKAKIFDCWRHAQTLVNHLLEAAVGRLRSHAWRENDDLDYGREGRGQTTSRCHLLIASVRVCVCGVKTMVNGSYPGSASPPWRQCNKIITASWKLLKCVILRLQQRLQNKITIIDKETENK